MPKRIDANQNEIVKTFRSLGASVLIISSIPKCCDLVVGKNKRNYLVEVKDGKKPPSARQLTPHEQIFHDSWRGQICIVNSIEDVIALVNEMSL